MELTGVINIDRSDVHAKGQGQSYEMIHKAWRGVEEVTYCFQGHPSNFNVTRAVVHVPESKVCMYGLR